MKKVEEKFKQKEAGGGVWQDEALQKAPELVASQCPEDGWLEGYESRMNVGRKLQGKSRRRS